jgi:hypothetical protein
LRRRVAIMLWWVIGTSSSSLMAVAMQPPILATRTVGEWGRFLFIASLRRYGVKFCSSVCSIFCLVSRSLIFMFFFRSVFACFIAFLRLRGFGSLSLSRSNWHVLLHRRFAGEVGI